MSHTDDVGAETSVPDPECRRMYISQRSGTAHFEGSYLENTSLLSGLLSRSEEEWHCLSAYGVPWHARMNSSTLL